MLRSRRFEELQKAYPLDSERVFDAMLDTPEGRRHEIVPGLWLGNQVAAGGMVPLDERTPEFLAATKASLRANGITHILCLAEGLCCYPDDFTYMQVCIADHGDSVLGEHFESTAAFIRGALDAGGAVLVHCNAGVSRSSSIVIAFLIRRRGWSFEHATLHVRERRIAIDPSNFQDELLALERSMAPGAGLDAGAGAMAQGCALHTRMRDVVELYDAFLLDQWGVLWHESSAPYPCVRECLEQIHRAGKRIVVLSNSSVRAHNTLEKLRRLGLATPGETAVEAAWTGGEVAWQLLHGGADPELRDKRVLVLAQPGNGQPYLEALAAHCSVTVDAEEAELVLLCGYSCVVAPDGRERCATKAELDGVLEACAARGVPMLCTNPDMRTPTGYITPGTYAKHYESLGGSVRYCGKPHAAIYAEAVDGSLRDVPRARVAAIGDSLHHDIRGARDAGIASVLITGGMHAEALGLKGGPQTAAQIADMGALHAAAAALFEAEGITPDHAVTGFQW